MYPNPGKAVAGGVVGTAIMTLMMFGVAPIMLGHSMDVAGMLAGMFGGSWAMGMLAHLVNGSLIFPLVYAYLLFRRLPGAPWTKGMLWGLMLWFVSQVVVMPLMGGGLFSAHAGGLMAVMASLVAHAIYGTVLGALAGAAEGAPARAAHAAR